MRPANPHRSDEELLRECLRVIGAIRKACIEEDGEFIGGWVPDERRLDITSHPSDPLYGDAVGLEIQLERRLRPAHKSGSKNSPLTAATAAAKLLVTEGEGQHGT